MQARFDFEGTREGGRRDGGGEVKGVAEEESGEVGENKEGKLGRRVADIGCPPPWAGGLGVGGELLTTTFHPR